MAHDVDFNQPAAHPWGLTDHACSVCLGRVLVSLATGGTEAPQIFRCSNCGAQAEAAAGLAHPPICACGMKVGARAIGVQCVRNERPRPEMPGEILVREIA